MFLGLGVTLTVGGCQQYALKVVDAESRKPLAGVSVLESWQGGTIKPFGGSGHRTIGPTGSDGIVRATNAHIASDMEYGFVFELPGYASAELWRISASTKWRLRYFAGNETLGFAIEVRPNRVTTIPMRRVP